jgi:hypothetical protein
MITVHLWQEQWEFNYDTLSTGIRLLTVPQGKAPLTGI